ncbi:Cyclin-D-binding Myb-like transcription factor 1 [Entomortierella beljakovae]|nr:Cyclin-D-binding Myb-like transcription factor 1 [Entomortierella beljakovae]
MPIVEIRHLIRSTVCGALNLSSAFPRRVASNPIRVSTIISTLKSRRFHNSSFSFKNPDHFPSQEDSGPSSTEIEYELRHHSRKGSLWSPEEIDILKTFGSEGRSFRDIVNDLPERTVMSIEAALGKTRKIMANEAIKLNGGIPILPEKHKKSTSKRWTVEEDTRLMDAVKRLGYDWNRIAEDVVDGKRLGRSGLACKRRWDITMEDTRVTGRWNLSEVNRLHDALCKLAKSRGESSETAGSLFSDLDLSSIDWNKVSDLVETRSDVQCRSHVYKSILSKKIGFWSEDEIEKLVSGIKKYGLDWKKLEGIVGTRSAYQIKQKYYWSSRYLRAKLGTE